MLRAGLLLATVCGLSVATSTSSPAQASSVRDSVRILLDRALADTGSFGDLPAIGDFTGNKAPFTALFHLSETATDSVLLALADCFSDSSATRLRYQRQPLSRGGLCYLALHNIAYRETDPSEHWAGNYYGSLTAARLRAAQRAWRQTILRHWYNTL